MHAMIQCTYKINIQVEIARVLHRDHGVPVEEIAILTPYSAQKDKIQKESQATRDIRKLKVASINESQGLSMHAICY